jgi:hypothetical protein
MKEVVKLKQVNKTKGLYKVISLENRTDPLVGDVITIGDVDELLLEVRRNGRLTVKIS